MSEAQSESLYVGSACAIVGLIGAGTVAIVRQDPSSGGLIVAALLSAFLSGTCFWALFVARSPSASRGRVVLVMSGAATVGHFLTWGVFAIINNPQSYIAAPTELLKVPILAVIFGLGSLVLIGWLHALPV